jgi:RNA polymerase sigma-70 factor (ECF subfamily)
VGRRAVNLTYLPRVAVGTSGVVRGACESSDQSAQISKGIDAETGLSGRSAGLPKVSDEVLFEQLREGDREALAILFRRYARLVRGVAYRILLNASEADDLVQEVFLFIFRKSGLFNHELGSARSWIVQVTHHRAVDRRRYLSSRHFYKSVELENEITGANGFRQEIAFYEQSIEGVLGKEILKKIDNALSEDQRRTINLHFFEGYTLDEIAGLLGQTIGNVRNHYYRGLEKMRQQIFRAKLRVK